MQPNSRWPRFHEPIRRTLVRNLAIAAVVGAAFAFWKRDAGLLFPFSALALWFSLGGHYVEVVFLNEIRPRISGARLMQRCARLATWFIGGAILYVCMAITARVLLVQPPRLGYGGAAGCFLLVLSFWRMPFLPCGAHPTFYNGSD
jgi:hypothetical protein